MAAIFPNIEPQAGEEEDNQTPGALYSMVFMVPAVFQFSDQWIGELPTSLGD
jgi:hypothetical protein